jgi:hypothetical protein
MSPRHRAASLTCGIRSSAVRFSCGLVGRVHRDSPRLACAWLAGCGHVRRRVRRASACGWPGRPAGSAAGSGLGCAPHVLARRRSTGSGCGAPAMPSLGWVVSVALPRRGGAAPSRQASSSWTGIVSVAGARRPGAGSVGGSRAGAGWCRRVARARSRNTATAAAATAAVTAIRAISGQHSVTTPCNPDFLGGCYVIMFTGLQGVGQSQ